MRPHQLLPILPPNLHDPSVPDPDYFYKNVVRPLIPDFIRIMDAGLYIDRDAVEELRDTVNNVVLEVQKTLDTNPIIMKFQDEQYTVKYAEYLAEMEGKKKTIEHFTKDFDIENMVHRTYVMNEYLTAKGLSRYTLDKWSVNDIKKFYQIEPSRFIADLLDKTLEIDHVYVQNGMKKLAQDKMDIYNKSHYYEKIAAKTREDLLPSFNPGSSTQKKALFDSLGIEPLAYSSDTGEASWGRDQIEELFHATPEDDIDMRSFLQAFIDYSYSNIIKTNFMEAFDKYVVDGKLHGNLKNFGAKSYRPTSNAPNMLNMPSTGSIYAKPLKKCFIAPEGWLVWSIDYSALEDRVIANLSGDENKLAVFTEGIDGHSLGATYYFPDRVRAIIGDYTDNKDAARLLKAEVDAGNKAAKAVRQDGKPVTLTHKRLHTAMYVENYIYAGNSKQVML